MSPQIVPFGHPEVESRIAKVKHQANPEAHREACAAVARHEFDWGKVGSFDAAPSRFPASAVRKMVEEKGVVAYRATLLGQLAGKGAHPEPCQDPRAVAAETLRHFGQLCGAAGVVFLVTRMTEMVNTDEAELVELGAAVAAETARGETDDAVIRPLVERQWAVETRVPLRRKVLDAFKAAFPQKVAAAIGGGTEDLVSVLAESFALSGRLPAPDPAAGDAGRELADVDDQLKKLGAVKGIAPGPNAKKLQARREAIVKRLDELHATQVGLLQGTVRDQVDQVVKGDLDAWADLVAVMLSPAGAFPAGLCDQLPDAGVEALIAADPVAWRNALEASVQGGHGRESSV